MLVDTRAGRLFVEAVGQGPDVLLWHSFLCDGTMWRRQIAELSGRYRFINVDAPGHGRSERVRHAYTMDDCVDAAARVLDAMGIERAAVCGLSWGGMVGMRLAARRPERVAALVLMDTSGREERPWKKLAYRPMSAITSRFGPTRVFAPVLERIFFARGTRAARPDLVAAFIEGVMRMDGESLGHAVDAVIYARDDCLHELRRVKAPTLVIVGDEDRATPPAEAARVAAAIAGAELVRVPGAAHLSALEQPEQINALVAGFLDRHVARG